MKQMICIALLFLSLTSEAQVVTTAIRTTKNSGAPAFFEDITVHRIQLRLTTSRKEGSENDQGVYVQMHADDPVFYLSKGIDNFERGHTDTYDFLSANVNRITDVQFLKLGVKGDDGWRVERVELWLNHSKQPVFVKDFGRNGYSLDNKASVTITRQELRAHPNWRYTQQNKDDIWPLPRYLSKATIISQVEAAIGDYISQNGDFKWGTTSGVDTRWGPVVEAEYKDFNTLRFDLDLRAAIEGPNPEADIDFDLRVSCENGILKLEILNDTYGTNWVGNAQDKIREKGAKLLGKALATYFGVPEAGGALGGLLASFLDINLRFAPNSIPGQNPCKEVTVLTSGHLKLY